MERVLFLSHVLQFAFPALDEVDDVPHLAGCCCLRLKEFFYDSEGSDGEEYQPNPFRRRKKRWTPPSLVPRPLEQ